MGSAIESVLRQSYLNWELIIIDDGSKDRSSEIISLYSGDKRISIYQTEGIGLPRVCNFALSKALGEFVIRLDGDDVFDENILLVLTTYLQQHPKIAMVFPDYYLVDDFGEIYALDRRQQVYENNHVVDVPPHGACTLIRKAVIEEFGGYREDLGAQDGFDLWSKVREKYKIANINLPLFYYRRHGKNLTSNINKILVARRQIKLDAIKERLKGLKPIVAIIPCRENYDFVKNLWSQELCGTTLLERDITTCLKSDFIDKVIVTCDNSEAKAVVTKFADPRLSFALRTAKSTVRSESIVHTLEELVRECDPSLGGITVISYIQTPFVSTGTLDEAISSLVLNDADSAFGVKPISANVYRRTPTGLQSLQKKGILKSDFDQLYEDSNTFTVFKSSNLLSGNINGSKCVFFEVTPDETFFINSKKSLEMASIMSQCKV